MSDRQWTKRLAERMAGRPDAVRSGPRLTGTSTPGASTTKTTDQFGLPLPLGDAGDVLTVTVNGDGDTVASWEASTGGGASGRYRHFVLADDGAGGWGFVTATVGGQTWPVTALADLE